MDEGFLPFGQLAGNESINRGIYQCFDLLDPDDVATFVKKFRTRTDCRDSG